MSPIPRKRFSTEEEILAAIDAARKRCFTFQQGAIRAEERAEKFFKKYQASGKIEFFEKRQWLLESAQRKRNIAYNIEANVLPRLKIRLATFRTYILPTGFIDQSIPY